MKLRESLKVNTAKHTEVSEENTAKHTEVDEVNTAKHTEVSEESTVKYTEVDEENEGISRHMGTVSDKGILSEVRVYEHENGEIERVHVVHLDSFDSLDFVVPSYNAKAFERVAELYGKFIVPRMPWVFGQMILFRIPENYDIPKGIQDVCSTEKTSFASFLRANIKLRGGRPRFRNALAKDIYEDLERKGCLKVVRGKLPFTKIIMADDCVGFPSEVRKTPTDYTLKVNANFFVMDAFEICSPSDRIGTPIGLLVKDGKVINPPLFDREALVVDKEGKVSVKKVSLGELSFVIRGEKYVPGVNCEIYERPKHSYIRAKRLRHEQSKVTEDEQSKKGKGNAICTRYAVIVGKRVEAVYECGKICVPSSGFVLRTSAPCISPGDEVSYCGMEEVSFAVSVGNSIIRNGRKTEGFESSFYNIYHHFGRGAYPPSLYPLDFEKARAPRIAIGADVAGKPCILWAEGPGKNGYTPGTDSTGASLSEMAEICSDIGLTNAVNLDGGGSAQIILEGRRYLKISDRNKEDGTEAERAVPIVIVSR